MTKFMFHRLLAALVLGALAFSNQAAASGGCDVVVLFQLPKLRQHGLLFPYSSPAEYAAAYPQCFPGGSAAPRRR
jgi:hypothetical protein